MSPSSTSARKTVLVTGCAGYIGSHIAFCCIASGLYRVVTIDNFSNSFKEALNRVTKLAQEALPAGATQADRDDCVIDLYEGDVTIKSDIEQIFADYDKVGGIYAVIAVAAHKAVGESAEKPLQYYENNISSTISLMQVMEAHNVHRFVYSSSATVYGEPPVIPIPERSPMAPESCYGRTKMMAELIIKDVCDSKPDLWRAISLRYFNPAGAHPSGEIGEDPRGKPGNLLPLLAQLAVGKYAEDGLKVFGQDYDTPDGCCVRDYIHVMDLAQGHVVALAALERDEIFVPAPVAAGASNFGGSGGKFKEYNLGKGKGMSVLEMVAAMGKASGFEYKYTVIGRRVGDVPELTANPSLAEKELGFTATKTLEEMCRDLWNWQSKNPNGYE